MLVKRDSASRLAIKHPEFSTYIFLENSKVFSTVKIFFVKGSMTGTRNFAKLKEGVLIADRKVLNGGHMSVTFL